MSSRREQLGQLLAAVLGSSNVYFQPPPSLSMKYPCIRYKLGDSGPQAPFANARANDKLYAVRNLYTVTLIDANPDTLIAAKLRQLEYCKLVRCYTADNLNHYVFSLYW